jgi:hypothetical protein
LCVIGGVAEGVAVTGEAVVDWAFVSDGAAVDFPLSLVALLVLVAIAPPDR